MRNLCAAALLAACVICASAQDAKQRIKTIRELGKTGSESIARLQPYLTDPEIEVRVEAVKAIVELGSPRSIEPLVQATKDNDPEVQIRAVDGLVNFYSPGYVQGSGITGSIKRVGTAIKAKFTDTNDLVIDSYVQVRPEVIQALGALARGGSSMESRANAARAIGILRGRAALDDVIAAAHSKDDQVIYESLVAVQKIRDPESAEKIQFLLNDLNEKIQIAAIETTGLLQNKNANPRLRDALKRANSVKVKRAIVSAMAMLPDPQNRPVFEQYFRDKDDGLRAAAAEGFARLKNPADEKMLEQAFNAESKMNPRLSLAFAVVMLGQNGLGEFSPLQYLVNTLNSKAYRGVAQAFLTELTRDPGVRRTVYGTIKAGTRDEKVYLAQILARSGDEETLKYLDALAADPDPDVAQEGLRARRILKTRL